MEEGQDIGINERKNIYKEFISAKVDNLELLIKEIEDARQGNI